MAYQIYLVALALSCLFVVPSKADVVEDAIDTVKDGYQNTKDAFQGNETQPVPLPQPLPESTGNDTDRPLLNYDNTNRNDLVKLDVPYPGIVPEEAVGYNSNRGVSNTQDTNTNTNNGNVFCWECTIERTMDNRIVSLHDNVNHGKIDGSVCKNHQCQSNEDWCLVTYYRVYAEDGTGEGKRERHECGNRNMRDTDYRCQELLIEDKGHNKIVPRSCKTARSASTSVYSSISVSVSVILAIFSLAFLH